MSVRKGYKALNQWFVDALMKKQDKHQVDIAIGKLWMKFGKLKTTQSWRSSISVQVHAFSQTWHKIRPNHTFAYFSSYTSSRYNLRTLINLQTLKTTAESNLGCGCCGDKNSPITLVRISEGGKKSPRRYDRTVHSTSTSMECPLRILSNIAEIRSIDRTSVSGSTSGNGSSIPGWFNRSAASVYMHVSRSCNAGNASKGLGCFSRSIATLTICSATLPITLFVATSLSRPYQDK